MMNKAKLRMTKARVSDEDMAYTDKELKDMIIELADSHIDALNKLQTAEAAAQRAGSALLFKY